MMLSAPLLIVVPPLEMLRESLSCKFWQVLSLACVPGA